eukprot:758073-Hanusia_phi.AAC.3
MRCMFECNLLCRPVPQVPLSSVLFESCSLFQQSDIEVWMMENNILRVCLPPLSTCLRSKWHPIAPGPRSGDVTGLIDVRQHLQSLNDAEIDALCLSIEENNSSVGHTSDMLVGTSEAQIPAIQNPSLLNAIQAIKKKLKNRPSPARAEVDDVHEISMGYLLNLFTGVPGDDGSGREDVSTSSEGDQQQLHMKGIRSRNGQLATFQQWHSAKVKPTIDLLLMLTLDMQRGRTTKIPSEAGGGENLETGGLPACEQFPYRRLEALVLCLGQESPEAVRERCLNAAGGSPIARSETCRGSRRPLGGVYVFGTRQLNCFNLPACQDLPEEIDVCYLARGSAAHCLR